MTEKKREYIKQYMRSGYLKEYRRKNKDKADRHAKTYNEKRRVRRAKEKEARKAERIYIYKAIKRIQELRCCREERYFNAMYACRLVLLLRINRAMAIDGK